MTWARNLFPNTFRLSVRSRSYTYHILAFKINSTPHFARNAGVRAAGVVIASWYGDA
ncbi:MAG: hypothetical protein HC942_29150 [Microcoleus sp. SU_5_6]|nr:hypothetical protein [Microcoleus sp. SU_5_6]